MKRPFLQLPNQVARCPDLKPSEFRVLVALMSVKPCFPSHTDLVRWTGLGKNTVNRTLQSLKRKGVISWKPGNSFGKNNQYFVHQLEDWKIKKTTPKIGVELPPKCGKQNRLISNKELSKEYFDENLSEIDVENLEKSWAKDSIEIRQITALEKLKKIK